MSSDEVIMDEVGHNGTFMCGVIEGKFHMNSSQAVRRTLAVQWFNKQFHPWVLHTVLLNYPSSLLPCAITWHTLDTKGLILIVSRESGQLGPFQSRPPANSAHTNYKPY